MRCESNTSSCGSFESIILRIVILSTNSLFNWKGISMMTRTVYRIEPNSPSNDAGNWAGNLNWNGNRCVFTDKHVSVPELRDDWWHLIWYKRNIVSCKWNWTRARASARSFGLLTQFPACFFGYCFQKNYLKHSSDGSNTLLHIAELLFLIAILRLLCHRF